MAVRATPSRAVGQVLTRWLPLGAVLLAYWAAQLINTGLSANPVEGATNALGFALHVREPVSVDELIFGALPTTWLQDRWYTLGEVHWYDVPAALVHVSHFFVIPATAAVLFVRNRSRFRAWIGCVLLLAVIGIVLYIVYPMAPPWLAGRLGVVGEVHRISGIGWQYLHLDAVGSLLGGSQMAANPVAAMPSLHAASAALPAIFCWPAAAWWGRVLLAVYPIAMGVTLVYSGEHYMIDVLAGWLAAAAAVGGWRCRAAIRRRRTDRGESDRGRSDRGDRRDAEQAAEPTGARSGRQVSTA
jgi:membrane-associated phospholipid phosphatase